MNDKPAGQRSLGALFVTDEKASLGELLRDPKFVASVRSGADREEGAMSEERQDAKRKRLLRGLARLTGMIQPWENDISKLEKDLGEGQPAAVALRQLIGVPTRRVGRPRGRSLLQYLVVAVLREAGFKGRELYEAVAQADGRPASQVENWIRGAQRYEQANGPKPALDRMSAYPQDDVPIELRRAREIAKRRMSDIAS